MAFTPPSSGLSTEPIETSSEADWTFEDSTIGIANGSLTLLATANTAGLGSFPVVTWTQSFDITNYILPTDDWSLNYDGADPGWDITDTTVYPWDNNAPYAFKFETDTTTTDYLNLSQDPSGTTFSTDSLDNTNGYTIEMEILVESATTTATTVGHSLLIDDGTQKAELFFRADGIGVRDQSDFIPADLTSYTKIRIGIIGTELTIGLTDGSVVVLPTGADQASSGTTSIAYGKFDGTDSEAVSYLRNLSVLVDNIVVDEPLDTTPVYSSNAKTATSPSFAPNKAVRRFSALSFITSGETSAGTSTIQIEYNNDSVSDWTASGTAQTLTGDDTLDLTSIPTSGDGSDQVRFVFTMDGDGSAPTLAVDTLAISTTFEEAYVELFPNWGPTNGGNTVALELFNTTGLETPVSAATTTRVLIPHDEGTGLSVSDTVSGNSDSISSASNTDRTTEGPLGLETTYGVASTAAVGETFSAGIDGSVSISNPNATGIAGTTVTPITVDTDPTQVQFSQVVDVDADNVSHTAQRCVAPEAGEGFSFDFDTSSSGAHRMSLRLKVDLGEVEITVGSATWNFSSNEYSETQALSLRDVIADGNTFQIVAANGPASFQISNLELFVTNSASIELTGLSAGLDGSDDSDANSGYGVDIFITPHELISDNDTAHLLTVDSGTNDLIRLGLNKDGYVVVDHIVGGTTTSLTAMKPIVLERRYNIAYSFYRREGATVGYGAILIDGEVVALERSNTLQGPFSYDSIMVSNSNNNANSISFTAGQARVVDTPIRPETHAQSLGLADLFFQSTLQVPALTGDGSSTPKTLSLLHFNETSGPLVDDNAFWGIPTAEAFIPSSELSRITRGVDGISGTGVTMNEAGFDIFSSSDFNPQSADTAHSIFFYTAAMAPSSTSDIVNYVSDSDYGYSIQIDTDGYLVVNIFEGSTTPSRTETFDSLVLGDFSWHAVAIVLNPSTGVISATVDANTIHNAGSAFSSYLVTGAFDYMHVGYGTYLTLDQFTVLQGSLDQDTIDIWRIPSTVKGLPANEVFVNGVQLAADRVLPVDNRKCYVVMPEGTAGEAQVSASFNGVTISAQQPYSYVESYDRTIDQSTIPTGIKRTVSPFRVLDTVPDGQINLAYLDTRDISPDTNIQTVDLSDLDSDNLSSYLRGEFIMSSPTTGTGAISYAGQLDTKDFNLSNRSAAWRSGTSPQPLFHKYLAGRGRYYVSVPGATVDDVDMIRRSILVVDEAGQAYGREEFPWDIEVSDIDKNGNALPSNVFSVVIFTRLPYLAGETVFVNFRAADSLQSFLVQPGHREILNTVPIFKQAADSTDRDTYSLELQSDATYTITIRTS